jgi:hypothetical protein
VRSSWASNANRLDGERSGLEHRARRDSPEIEWVVELRVREPAAREGQRDIGAVNRNVEATQQIRNCTNMIFVRVGQDYRVHRNAAALKPGHLRDVSSEAQSRLVGKHHSAIDRDCAPGAFDRHQIEADLTEPTESHDAHGSGCRSTGSHR